MAFSWRLGAVGLAGLAGTFVHLRLVALPTGAMLAGLLVAAGVLAVAAARLAWCRPQAGWVLVPAVALLGFAVGVGQGAWRISEVLPEALEDEDLVLDGVVATLPLLQEQGVRFRFDVSSAHHRDRRVQVPRHVQLGWYVGWGGSASPDPDAPPLPDLRAGELWRFTARLRRPHGLVNPNGFDHELALFERGVRATGTVRPGARSAPERLGVSPWYPVERLRQRVRDRLFETVPDRRSAGVLAALAMGDQSAIPPDDWSVFRDTGVSHLVSISGLHVTAFAWLAALALRRAWARSARLSLRLPAPVAARVGGLAAATAYALFAGWGVPAQRTVWMLATVTLLQLGARRWPVSLVLLMAAVVVCLADPWALCQPGFWLSFVAVALLMAASSDPSAEPTRRWWHPVADGLRSQGVASVGLAPLSLVLFQQVSVAGFAANLLAIPVVTGVITPLALGGALFAPLWLGGAWVVRQGTAALAWMAQWPGAVWTAAVSPPWVQAAALCGGALAVLPLPWRLRLLAVPLGVPLLWPVVPRPPPGQFEVLAADVGQGSAVLVRTRHHLLVYDTGPAYTREANAGERVLVPLLRSRGEARIHRLALSHRDTDHVGGALPLLDGWPVDELLSSLEPGHRLLGRAATDRRCDAGQAWQWDGVDFQVLHPPAETHGLSLKPNAKSCVLRVSGPQGSLLLAGDIERAQEAALVAAGTPLASDVLLVPHHGSRTSSTAAFLDAVRPSVAVIQAGHRNRFGHPVPEVLARLQARGAVVVDSPGCGAWHWPGQGPPRSARCLRTEARRYWHHPADGRSGPAAPDSAKMPG